MKQRRLADADLAGQRRSAESFGAVAPETAWWRIVLVVLQGIGILAVIVLCAPTQRKERR